MFVGQLLFWLIAGLKLRLAEPVAAWLPVGEPVAWSALPALAVERMPSDQPLCSVASAPR